MTMEVVRSVADLRAQVMGWRVQGARIALVPTMGALHSGHQALMQAARNQGVADRVVASIFVNPTQFGPSEDFDAYPRQQAADIEKLTQAGVDLVYIPDVNQMYPAGFQTRVLVPDLSRHLCGAARPGHFDGVAQVVCKLFNQALPDVALFGEKDFQQLAIIRRMVVDLDLQVEVQGVPTVREEDGLALSSRNAYLSDEERAIAPALFQTLSEQAELTRKTGHDPIRLEEASATLIEAGFDSVDYLSACNALSLEELPEGARSGRLLVAAHLGHARLIDNVAI